MEELDFLKKHWNKEDNFPKINKDEIRRMLHKSSSSIVKWILIICCLEFLFGIAFKIYYVFFDDAIMKTYDIIFEVIGTITTAYFLILFLKEYNKIKIFTDTKSLMNSILITRNWVKKYIIITLGIILFQWFFGILDFSLYEDFMKGYNQSQSNNADIKISSTTLSLLLALVLVTIFIILILYYRFVYIRLLRRLKNNYEELISIEE